MNKKYSFPTEEKATELIKSLLSDEQKNTNIRKVSVTKCTNGLHYMGKTDTIETNPETGEVTVIKEGTTFDVDVMWRNEPLPSWEQYEVNPKTPNHNWALPTKK